MYANIDIHKWICARQLTFLIGLLAALDEAGAVLGEFSQRIDDGV